MGRIVAGVFAGFIAWVVVWVGSEKVLSALWPEWFGAHQVAFQAAIEQAAIEQAAIEDGSPFTADPTVLLLHVVLCAIVSGISGFLAALVAGENKRAPLALGVLLLAMGGMKAAMSWPLVPLWYHVAFTALLMPMAIVGGKVKATA